MQAITDIVLILTGFQLILLSVVLLSQKSVNHLNRNLLVAFLLSKTFLILRWLFFRFQIVKVNDFPYIYLASAAVFFLLAPLLYFYIRSLCYRDFRFAKSHLFHLMPFLFFVFFAIISVQLRMSYSATENRFVDKIFISHYWDIFWTLNFIQIISYIIAMLRTIYTYRRKLKNAYASLEQPVHELANIIINRFSKVNII